MKNVLTDKLEQVVQCGCRATQMQKIKSQHKEFLGNAASDHDLVPSANPEHLEAVWALYQRAHRCHPGEPVCFGVGELDAVLPAGVNVNAVAYRATVLNMLHHVLSNYSEKIRAEDPISHLLRFKQGDDLEERVCMAMARIRLEWMQLGCVYSGWPFDMVEFIRHVDQEAA